jgi:hypothetical protein
MTELLLYFFLLFVSYRIYALHIDKEHKMKNISNKEIKVMIVNIEEINDSVYAYNHVNSRFMSQGKSVNDLVANLVKMNSDIEFILVTNEANVKTIYDKNGNKVHQEVV